MSQRYVGDPDGALEMSAVRVTVSPVGTVAAAPVTLTCNVAGAGVGSGVGSGVGVAVGAGSVVKPWATGAPQPALLHACTRTTQLP